MPSTSRQRDASPSDAGRVTKKAKAAETSSITLPQGETRAELRRTYEESSPYKHAVVPGLLTEELLEAVVEESRTYGVRGEEGSLHGWGWEQKETDIYKIQQTPDLSSLDPEHLPTETLDSLPCLTRLKDSLYSPEFRQFVRDVTGCGPLSGLKTDGSVGLYTQGSHLLLHDDSISTRVISYILYLPNSPLDAPESEFTRPAENGKFGKGWDPTWGGSLELYPVESGEERGLPGTKRSTKVDVNWGQIIFFEVQPGRSYHAVEEVVVGDNRQRLGVSGWFHRPIEGEEGYEAYDDTKAKQALSSLAQITSAPTIPIQPYVTDPPAGLTPAHISFLAPFLAPSYLTTETLEKLNGQFVAASEIVLHNFLRPELADKLKAETEATDRRDSTGGAFSIPPQDLGEGDGWTLQGPISKHRYASLTASSTSTPTLRSILTTLLPSEAFRAWLSVVSALAPTGYRTEARRFRRGLDYILAAGEERSGEARLDVWLGATWWAAVPAGSDEEDKLFENGGWECYLAAPDESEDPAVYQSALAKKANGSKPDAEPAVEVVDQSEAPVASSSKPTQTESDQPSIRYNGVDLEFDPDQFSPSDFDTDSEGGDDDDDGPLLTQPVAFNKLLLVLRDPGVMRFVKYLSAGAEGSRWDVGGEWEVGIMEEDDEDEEQPGEEA